MKRALFTIFLTMLFFGLIAQTPDWVWANKLERTGECRITTDKVGNTYVTGHFDSTSTFGSIVLTSNGGADIFIAKSDTKGNWLWAIKAGGIGDEGGNSIAVDDTGNVYICGVIQDSIDFGITHLTSSGKADIFVAKLDSKGNWLWASKAGGNGTDYASFLVIDKVGNTYISGSSENAPLFGEITLQGNHTFFVAKLDPEGNWLWTKEVGTNTNHVSAIAVDKEGSLFVSGDYSGVANFDTISLTSIGMYHLFAGKMDTDGKWLWVSNSEGKYGGFGWAITVDDQGNSYVAGNFNSKIKFGPNTLKCGSGKIFIFVAKLDSNGKWLWARKAGGNDYNFAISIAVDVEGNPIFTGCYEGKAHFGKTILKNAGEMDAVVAKLNPKGKWLWAIRAGSTKGDEGHSIAVDQLGNAYIGGGFLGTVSFGNSKLVSSGKWDRFIAKIGLP